MKVKESILEEIGVCIDGKINELSKLARKYAEIDNYRQAERNGEGSENDE